MEDTKKWMPKVSLDDISAFLARHDEKELPASVEDRTECAIILLQSLPCARYAVLEKLGEVFFEEAKHYILEVERQHLSGMPNFSSATETKQEAQIQKIKTVLIEATEANASAWSPMIFQWAVQTLGQICTEYGVQRHFNSLTLEERFQMWLECSATKHLLEVINFTLQKILPVNPDACLKKLLGTTITCSPYFDWAFVHICYSFSEIFPYKLLRHSLEAFSNQSRQIELIIGTLITVFSRIYKRKPDLITSAILQLFKESLTDTSDESNNDSNHNVLCTVPFLLHISTKSINLFMPLVDQALDLLTPVNLKILHVQSSQREDVLQRGLLRRIVECIKMLETSSYRLFQFLLKHASKEVEENGETEPDVVKATQSICSILLEYLRLQLKSDVHIYTHQKAMESQEEPASKSPFLTSVGKYSKQLCAQLLDADGIRMRILHEIIMLISMQEGKEKMVEVLLYILVNGKKENQKLLLNSLIPQFRLLDEDIVANTFNTLFANLSYDQKFTKHQIQRFFISVLEFIEEEKTDTYSELRVMDHIKQYGEDISRVLVMCENEELAITCMKLLREICSLDLRISKYAIIAQAVISYFFTLIEKVKKKTEESGLGDINTYFKECDGLLVHLINEYPGIQQFAVRMLMEGIVREEKEEQLSKEVDEPLIRVELLEENFALLKNNRFHSNTTSVMYRDGLKLNKRKLDHLHPDNEKDVHQHFMMTFSNVLSIAGGFGVNNKSIDDRNATFARIWSDRSFSTMSTNSCSYAATVLVELVCPEVIPYLSWPDEDFLKHTIERDLKVKNKFDGHPILWNILEVISTARQSLYYCSVIVQSLFAMFLKYWLTNRNHVTSMTSPELAKTCRLIYIMNQAGWLPSEVSTIADVFQLIKPKEVYEILLHLWKYLTMQEYSPVKFIERDQLGRPELPVNPENLQQLRSVIKITLLRNIASLGQYFYKYKRALEGGNT